MTLFTIDSKDNTGSTRQDKPRKIPCANACGWLFMTIGPPQYIVPVMRNRSEVLTSYSPRVFESMQVYKNIHLYTEQTKGSH